MFFENESGYKAARTGMATLVISLAATLAACGGGDDGGAKPAASKAEANSALEGTTPVTFDGVFLVDGGAGYYQFAASYKDQNSNSTLLGTVKKRLYVYASSDTSFSQQISFILGEYSQSYPRETYITAEGAVTPDNLKGETRIFQKLPHGYQSGVPGISAPLFEITLGAQDISGQPVGQAIAKDFGAYGNGLNRVLGNVDTPMPQGSQMYQSSVKVLTTHLWVSSALRSNETSLEQAQAKEGGTILTLGGYRYLPRGPSQLSAYVEYEGEIYSASLQSAGRVENERSAAYNTIAGDFILEEQQKVGLPA